MNHFPSKASYEMRPLTAKQIKCLAAMCNQAYRKVGEQLGYSSLKEFRAITIGDVTGKDSLKLLTNSDFTPTYNRLSTLLGQPLKDKDGFKGNPIAYFVQLIRESCQRYELSESYAAKIAANKLGLHTPQPLDTSCIELGVQGCKQVLYTINNRGRAKLRSTSYNYPEEDDYYEPHTTASMPPARLADHFNCKNTTTTPPDKK